ncbi:hypothetical protein [Methylobacterium nodulans]|uniref:Uncharacterized protein n=1 Tax=Methylobacterium nodulans (strain LMG 21967 / CNCM I-2342 / ORS 2060) TaxID=460265 RepID=B8IJ34_METNO|nr:hypothetical protein [Methylobacterium nodulans]ACL61829.1 conserved hypothetical protein [Methylobacterium nodulans ORS 2060]
MLLVPLLALATALGHGADRAAALARTSAAEVAAQWRQTVARAEALAAPAAEPPLYQVSSRAVSNWRAETRTSLRPLSLALVAATAPVDPAFVARCVKLNNYWCIKRAGWDGEVGADAEGHTGFATAEQGADAAVSLLRRYYTVLGRRSALAIVRRWAPAECGAPVAAARRPAPVAAAPSSPALAALAPKGIGRTLRARYLAARGRGFPVRRAARPSAAPAPAGSPASAGGPALRVQPWSALARLSGRPRGPARPLPLMATPSIATGIGEAPARAGPARTAAVTPSRILDGDRLLAEAAALPSITSVAALPPSLRPPAPLCSSDETRIQAYAARIAGSVGLKAGDDLGLFDPEGRATDRLAPVLLAMSSVELGSLQATPSLVAAAIARADTTRPRAEGLATPHQP